MMRAASLTSQTSESVRLHEEDFSISYRHSDAQSLQQGSQSFEGTAAGISSLQTTSRKGIKESKSKLCNKPEEKRESCTLPYHEESASPCCAQSLEVAMILSNLHSGEQFDPKEDPPKATRMTGGSGEYDEDWYEDSSCDLTTGKNIGDSFDYSHDRVPQFTSPLCAKMPKFTSPTSAQQMIPLHDLQDGHGNEGSGQRKGSIRTGKWSLEEEQFVRALVSHFRSGSLNIPPGTTLRSYLAEKLDCDPMRITKKFSAFEKKPIGKVVYKPCRELSLETIDAAHEEIQMLEFIFRAHLNSSTSTHFRGHRGVLLASGN